MMPMLMPVRARRRRLAIALLAALAAGLLLLSLPVGLIETLVASSGLSEALPAAAPPLGMKARLLLAGFGALMALGLVSVRHGEKGAALLAHAQEGRRKTAPGVSKMGFALSKLNWLSRGRGEPQGMGTGMAPGTAPALRRADAHPDAPARQPIFASRDFGGLDIFARTTPGRGEAQDQPPAARAMPAAPAAAVEDSDFARLHRAFAAVEEAEPAPVADMDQQAPRAAAPRIDALSLTELTERLERGLAQRKRSGRPVSVIAEMPVERAVPVRAHVEQDADQALRAALGTLRSMAGRRR